MENALFFGKRNQFFLVSVLDGKKLDKSGILRATIAFLKKHNEWTQRNRAFEIDLSWKPSFLSNDEFSQMMMESIDGFCISFQQVRLPVCKGCAKRLDNTRIAGPTV